MTAPYVVRDENGEYRKFLLPTEGPGPYGAGLLVFLGLNEYLNVDLLAAALQQSITGTPPGGTWYRTAYVRAIRTGPGDNAARVGTLIVGGEVEIMDTRVVRSQDWGAIGYIRILGKSTYDQRGNWIKLLGMTKI